MTVLRNTEVLEDGKMAFPAVDADASFLMTNHRTLYEDKKHRVAGTTFNHRKMAVRPQLATHMNTVGGEINYMHKPAGKANK